MGERFSGSGNNWVVQDSERQKYNPVSDCYYLLNQINQTASGLNVDFLSNGFKIRHTNGNMNASSTYVLCLERNPHQSTCMVDNLMQINN